MREAQTPSSNSVTASSAGSAAASTSEIACATPRSVVRTESLVPAMPMVPPPSGRPAGASCGGRWVAFELHTLGADGLGQLVEEGVPQLVDVLRGVLRLFRFETPVGVLDDEAVADQSLQRVGDVEVDADAEARREVLLDGRVDVGNVLAPRLLLRQHAVEQHLFLDVLL